MDWLTFIVEMAKAGSWPIAAVLIAILFREQLRHLLARLKRGKLGPAEFEFEEDIKVLRQETDLTATLQAQVSLAPQSVALAGSDPRVAVLNAWLEVESAAMRLAQKENLLAPENRNPLTVIRAIDMAKLIDSPSVALFYELRSLRNRAAHELDFNPSTESVLSYIQFAKKVKDALDNAAAKL